MACNIDSKGKAVRLTSGLATLFVGLILLLLTIWGVIPQPIGYIFAAAAGIGGVFQVYEGWAGWCVVRAMGFKTPI